MSDGGEAGQPRAVVHLDQRHLRAARNHQAALVHGGRTGERRIVSQMESAGAVFVERARSLADVHFDPSGIVKAQAFRGGDGGQVQDRARREIHDGGRVNENHLAQRNGVRAGDCQIREIVQQHERTVAGDGGENIAILLKPQRARDQTQREIIHVRQPCGSGGKDQIVARGRDLLAEPVSRVAPQTVGAGPAPDARHRRQQVDRHGGEFQIEADVAADGGGLVNFHGQDVGSGDKIGGR